MTTDNWINLIAAILVGGGTLALAVMAYKAIRQTNKLRREEKIQRELNEICQWGIDITEIPSQVSFDIRLGTENMKRKGANDLWLRYNILTGRSVRIKVLSEAEAFKAYKLHKKVGRVCNSLHRVMQLLDKRSKGELSDKDVTKDGELLHKRADNLVKAITEIRNKVIK